MMNQASDSWLQYIVGHGEIITTWVVPGSVFLFALFLLWPSLKRKITNLYLLRKVKKIGQDSLHEVVIPDGIDGHAYIEHLVLLPNAIYLFSLHHYQGVVFAADNIDTWTQVVGKRSYKFLNPLRQLEVDILAVKANVPDINVNGRVLFTKGVKFPKGKPERVVSIVDVKSELAVDIEIKPSAALIQSWDKIKSIAQSEDMQLIKEQMNFKPNEQENKSGWMAVLMMLSAAAWLAWRLSLS